MFSLFTFAVRPVYRLLIFLRNFECDGSRRKEPKFNHGNADVLTLGKFALVPEVAVLLKVQYLDMIFLVSFLSILHRLNIGSFLETNGTRCVIEPQESEQSKPDLIVIAGIDTKWESQHLSHYIFKLLFYITEFHYRSTQHFAHKTS